jgi:hypothetical protein
MDHTARLVRLYGWQELPSGKGEKRKWAQQSDSAFFAANTKIRNNQPFIAADIFDLAIAHCSACKNEIDEFFGAVDAEEKNDTWYD